MAAKKSPKKRAAPAADDAGEAAIARIHEAGERLLEPGKPDLAPALVTREAPEESQAEAAAAEEPGSTLASAVQRALRFADKEHALLRLTDTSVVGASRRGTVIVPIAAKELPAHGIVVDGRKLHRCLRAAGEAAQLVTATGKLEIRFGTRRFSIATIDGAELNALMPPAEGVNYCAFKPSVFLSAASFAGDDKIEPLELSGVNVSLGGCVACDRRGLIVSFNATDNSQIQITLPRDAFDGLSVGPDGNEAVWFGLTPNGHAVIADPRTGEWRVIIPFGSNFPDVRGVLQRWDATTHADVDKAAFVSALKQFRIVQSAGSSVRFNVWTTESGEDWIEMRGGDPGNTCEFVARLGVKIQRTAPVGTPGRDGMLRVCVALDEVLKLATAFPAATVRLGFGADERSPLVVKNHVFEAGVLPMIER